MGVFNDLFIRLNKPKVILVAGEGQKATVSAISEIFKTHFKMGRDVLVLGTDFKNEEKINFLIKNSSLFVLIMTSSGAIPQNIVKNLQKNAIVILNHDDEKVRLIKNEVPAESLTFGFQPEADLSASDVAETGEVNFKMNYRGSSVPVWLRGSFSKDKIYAVLAAALCGVTLGLNLVEISQTVKEY